MSSARCPTLLGAVGWPVVFAQRYRAAGLWSGQSLGAWFFERVALFGEREAVVDGARRVSYAQLGERVARLRVGLCELGIAQLDRVVVQLPNGLELIETLLAVLAQGAIPVLALPAHRRVELEAFCVRARARVLIVPARHGSADVTPLVLAIRERCPALEHVLVHGSGHALHPGFEALEALPREGRRLELPHISAAEVALLQLSGGSTGVPKLIARTHDDYLYSVRQSVAVCRVTADTRFLTALPINHNFTLSSPGVLGVLHAGGCVVTCAHPAPELVFRLLREERVTLIAAVPSLARSWVEAKPRYEPERKYPELVLQVGGARLDEQLARATLAAFGCQLQQVFGMAEGLVNYTRMDAALSTILDTQGRPMSLFDEVRVVDPEDPEGPALADGCAGELQTRGPYTIRGYFDDPEADARCFTRDGFYRTGDLVRRTAAGDLIVEGRLGDRILRGGEKIAPEEVEAHLRQHTRVRDAAVVGASDAFLGQRSHAFVVLDSVMPLACADVRVFLRQRGLAEFKLPDVLHVVTELPRTKVGKPDRRALRERLNVSQPNQDM